MEPSSLNSPRTPPPRAASEGPTPPPRNSMEDADSSVKRKRPRLDSGETAYRSMSAEPSSTVPASSELGQLPASSDDPAQDYDPIVQLTNASTQTPGGTPSKVTINVREPHSPYQPSTKEPMLEHMPSKEPQTFQQGAKSDSGSADGEPMLINQDAAPSSPSPVGSPEIEVAEPEDMGGPVGPTVWHKPGMPIEKYEQQLQRLMVNFPFIRATSSTAVSIQRLHDIFQRGELGDGEYLRTVAGWLRQWLLLADRHPSHLFDIRTTETEFWSEFHHLAGGLMKRSHSVDQPIFFDKRGDEDFSDNPVNLFLTAYAGICARFLQMDRQTLIETLEDPGVDPDLGSRAMVSNLGDLMTEGGPNMLYRILVRGKWSLQEITSGLVHEFLSPTNKGVETLSACVDLLLERSPFDSDTLDKFLGCAAKLAAHAGPGSHLGERRGRRLAAQLLELFKTCDTKLRSMISKQVSCLTHDVLKQSITTLSYFLRAILAVDEATLDAMLPEDFENFPTNIDYAQRSPAERAALCELAWKFDLLLKCIINGRMDSRITGVEEMQTTMVGIFHAHIRNQAAPTDSAVANYAAHFLLEKKLVDYLVGVESHPRLLSESKNIVCFLVVSQKYGKKETDMIWNSMLSSQDPRTAEAILNVLKSLTDFAEPPVLAYFVEKLMELPIEAFDSRMTMFLGAVIELRVHKWGPSEPLDPLIFSLLIRLLRECPASSSLSNTSKIAVYEFAVPYLRTLGLCGLALEDKKQILAQIFNDISECTVASTGSVVALNMVWEPRTGTEDVVNEAGSPERFATLIVQDFGRLRETEKLLATNVKDFFPLLQHRLELLQKLITVCPNSLSSELMTVLWKNLVGGDALNNECRDGAWAMLTRAAQSSRAQRNGFFEKCIAELLPSLESEFLTPAVLEFASQLTRYEDQLAKNNVRPYVGEDSLPGDIFWHIALSATSKDTGHRAIAMFVERNTAGLSLLPGDVASEKQTRLVERCIQCLTGAASQFKRLASGSTSSDEDSMVIVPSEKDLRAVKLRFVRSLSILKDFLLQVRGKHPASPASVANSLPSQQSLLGDEVTIRYQPHVSGKSSGMHSLKIGDLTPLKDLAAQLSHKTGFSEFQLIAAGQRIDQVAKADVPVRDLRELFRGLVLILKIPGSKSNKGNGVVSSLLPLEKQVMAHFSELYDLLCPNQDFGCEVFEFLITFPPHEGTVTMASSAGCESSDVFPMQCPYKALYSIYALKGSLAQRLQEGAPCDDLLRNGVQKIADGLTGLDLNLESGLGLMQMKLVGALVDCLLRFLKEPVPEATSDSYFKHPVILLDRLRELISAAQNGLSCPEKISLVHTCFAASLEACLHCPPMWEYFREGNSSALVLRNVWLECPETVVRNATTHAVRAICTTLPDDHRMKAQDFVSYFWAKIVDMIPDATRFRNQAEQFFHIAIELFRKFDDTEAQALPLPTYLNDWAECLLKHKHEEFVGQPSVDTVVNGLAALLDWCLQLLKAKKSPIALPENLMYRLFTSHIFPITQLRDDTERVAARVPVLNPKTRISLYSFLFSLVADSASYHGLLKLLKQLVPPVPERTAAWSHGLAQISKDYSYEATWNFDRNRAIRSSSGYAGLKNLSNTCYLNSLLMQLFMNINFRDFVLNMKLTDAKGPQKLLQESQKLFAYLQETWLKAVDPDNVVGCIATFDNQAIDVTVQMDVDEFYNLLFDRWESQILLEDDKKTFRRFYGGELVQQIKSQDCPHISERVEPFSVIQCDIQGKTTLTESLSAFIEGEMMQGGSSWRVPHTMTIAKLDLDNKYKCGSCDAYVNAIKRACLKDIPDNLIFHLKRFDYDLMSGMRSKVNDYFEFPQEIDMTPYNVEYLKDTQQPATPDNFLLVGVLVHSGNAEAGHYYSYIRERPGIKSTWVEMNDADVTAFDPACIQDQCFGGWTEQPYSNMQYPKSWNAYMLFYRRFSAMEVEEKNFAPADPSSPVRAMIPLQLANRISSENENWVRKYCLFGHEHAAFTRRVVEHYRKIREDQCSEDHSIERDLIQLILHQTETVFARAKDCQLERDTMIDCLWKMLERCTRCCEIFLREITKDERPLRALILRCPDESFRRRLQSFIFGSLKLLKDRDLRLYAPEMEYSDSDSSSTQSTLVQSSRGLFQETVLVLRELLHYMHFHTRVWDEYYGLMLRMASMGRYERWIVHESGFLQTALQYLYGESRTEIGLGWPLVESYLRARNRRRISFKNLVSLVNLLLKGASDPPRGYDGDEPGFNDSWSYSLVPDEFRLIKSTVVDEERGTKIVPILQAALAADGIDVNVLKDLVRTLVQDERFNEPFVKHVSSTILTGASVEPAALAGPYLQAGLAYCETCSEPNYVRIMITKFAKEVASINDSGGPEHLDFFVRVAQLYNPLVSHHSRKFFQNEILRVVPHFAPYLLFYPEREVRMDTVEFLKRLLFERDVEDDEFLADNIEHAGAQLLEGLMKVGSDAILQRKSLDPARVSDLINILNYCFEQYCPRDSDEWESLNDQIRKLKDMLVALAVASPDDALSGEYDSDEALTDTSNLD